MQGINFNKSKKKVDEDLKNLSQETYHQLFEESSDLICILDKEGIIIDINQTLIKLLKYSKKDLIGKNVEVFSAANSEKYDRDEINKKAWNYNLQTFTKSVKDYNGKIIPLEVLMQRGKYFGEDVLISISRDIAHRYKFQKELNRSIDSFKSLFNNAPISMAIISVEGKFMDVNEAMIQLFNYSKEEFLNKYFTDISFPEDRKLSMELFRKLLSNEIDRIELEKNFRCKNGERITALLKVILEKNSKGEALRMIAQIDDITSLKKAQGKLVLSEQSYKQLFNNTNDCIYILDFIFNIVDVNETVLNKYGYTKEELIGKSIMILSETSKNNPSENTKQSESLFAFGNDLGYYWGKSKDGQSFPMEISTKKGYYFGKEVIFCTGRDISERYKYEDKLRKQEERYRNLFERNLAGIFRLNTEGMIIECNPAFVSLFGFTSVDEMKNKMYLESFYFDNEEHSRINAFLASQNYIKDYQISFRTEHQKEVVALLNLSLIKNNKNEVLYQEGSIIDISEQIRAERLLSESREQYKNLVESSASGLFIHDDGVILIANSRAAEILGFSSVEDIVGHNIYFDIDPVVVKEIKQRVSNALEGKKEAFREFVVKKKDGEKIVIETKPIKIVLDGKAYVQVTFNDITQRKKNERSQQQITITESINKALKIELEERKKIERDLKNAHSYTEGIFQSSLDMIFTLDVEGNINNFNLAAQKAFGYTNNEIKGKDLKWLFDKEEKSNEINNALENEGKYTGEIYCKRKSGQLFIAYFSVSYLKTVDGIIRGIMGISRDITELKKNEKELKLNESKNRRQAAKLNSIMESSSHYFFTLDKNYNIQSFNKKFQNDVNLVNNINVQKRMNFFEVAFKEEDIKPKERWKKFIDRTFNGERSQFEIKRITGENEVVYREVFLDPIKREDGIIEEISGIGHDTTDKKLNQRKVQKSLEEKEVLLKEVHHRVKNNMQVISSILSLQGSYVSDPQILNVLNESQNRIKAMAYIHESLYRTTDFSHIDFSKYVKNLTINLIETYELRSNEVHADFDLEDIFLNLDSAIPCGLIINELISNALKYAFVGKNNGLIYISLKDKKKIELIVSDDGIGFPQDIDYTNTDSLGLQLVTTLVEQLNGELNMKSSTDGTSFIINFPKIQ